MGNRLGTCIKGTLKLSSPSASAVTTFQNPINLNGGARTIQVDDNPGVTSDDYAVMSGAISDSVGGASLTKTGTGTLYMQGSGNTYSGMTTILGGDVYLNKTSGYAIPGDLILGGSTTYHRQRSGNNQIAPTSKWTFNGSGGMVNYPAILLNVMSISSSWATA